MFSHSKLDLRRKRIIEAWIEHLQEWMADNPKYSEEFKKRAAMKDRAYQALLTFK